MMRRDKHPWRPLGGLEGGTVLGLERDREEGVCATSLKEVQRTLCLLQVLSALSATEKLMQKKYDADSRMVSKQSLSPVDTRTASKMLALPPAPPSGETKTPSPVAKRDSEVHSNGVQHQWFIMQHGNVATIGSHWKGI